MFVPRTYWDLTAAMKTMAPVTIDGKTGRISSIQLEDGSGRNFNVTLQIDSPRPAHGVASHYSETVFFREGY